MKPISYCDNMLADLHIKSTSLNCPCVSIPATTYPDCVLHRAAGGNGRDGDCCWHRSGYYWWSTSRQPHQGPQPSYTSQTRPGQARCTQRQQVLHLSNASRSSMLYTNTQDITPLKRVQVKHAVYKHTGYYTSQTRPGQARCTQRQQVLHLSNASRSSMLYTNTQDITPLKRVQVKHAVYKHTGYYTSQTRPGQARCTQRQQVLHLSNASRSSMLYTNIQDITPLKHVQVKHAVHKHTGYYTSQTRPGQAHCAQRHRILHLSNASRSSTLCTNTHA